MSAAPQSSGSRQTELAPYQPRGQKKREPVHTAHAEASSQYQKVDFSKLDISALRRYRRYHKLADVGPNSAKEHLVVAASRHFNAQQADEMAIITGFLQCAKRLRQ
eukprot:jgi/Mesen1/2110/ME000151S01362